jgi:hypothetical protein
MIDSVRLKSFMKGLGALLAHEARIFLRGGASAILTGWRTETESIDLTIVPDRELARILPRLEKDFQVGIGLAYPDQFIPIVPGWEERSPVIGSEGRVTFHHFDYYAQALEKLERNLDRDREDVVTMVRRGLILPHTALSLFHELEPNLAFHPAVDATAFRRNVLGMFSVF